MALVERLTVTSGKRAEDAPLSVFERDIKDALIYLGCRPFGVLERLRRRIVNSFALIGLR